MTGSALVVRFSAVGDCVLAAWPATSIRSWLGKGSLVWACESRCAPVIDRDRLASDVWVFEREAWKRARWSPATWWRQLRAYTGLRRLRFDLGVDLQGHSKTALCLRLAAPRRRYAARATDALARRLNPIPHMQPEGPHEMHLYRAFLRSIGAPELPERPHIPTGIPPAAQLPDRMVSISTGATNAGKQYPVESWRAVARALANEGFGVVGLGGPLDPRLETPGALDLAGLAGWPQTIGVIRASLLHLSADTGAAHIAAAVGTPCVTLFGPTDPDRFRPWSDKAAVLRAGTTDSIPTDHVLAAAYRALSGDGAALSH